MAMSRKDFDRIAFNLAMQEPSIPTDYRAVAWHHACCEAVSEALVASNPRFRKEYFLEACKFEYWKNRKQPR